MNGPAFERALDAHFDRLAERFYDEDFDQEEEDDDERADNSESDEDDES